MPTTTCPNSLLGNKVQVGSFHARSLNRSLSILSVSANNDDEAVRSFSIRSEPHLIQRKSPNIPTLFFSGTASLMADSASFLLACFLGAVLLVGWEEYTSTFLLPSRQQRVHVLEESSRAVKAHNRFTDPYPRQPMEHSWQPISSSVFAWHYWGEATIKGLGFGRVERLQLQKEEGLMDSSAMISDSDTVDRYGSTSNGNLAATNTISSYNEVGLMHRTERVARWKRLQLEATSSQRQRDRQAASFNRPLADAAHILIQSLQTVWKLRALANDYQWNQIRDVLRSDPSLLRLEDAASHVRAHFYLAPSRQYHRSGWNGVAPDTEDTIGFDWGSCAWRHCGALADAQEALDELDHLLGVLEPNEAIFCLDIVERSVRDILTVVDDWGPGSKSVLPDDAEFYLHHLPEYVPLPSAAAARSVEQDGVVVSGATDNLDDLYIKTLQDLRLE